MPVFALLADSFKLASKTPGTGIRIRLAPDPDLMNLPWEYLYRPDNNTDSVSGFFMLDPAISIVREDANPRIRITSITGKQKLVFVGTFWEGGSDHWQANDEFEKLRSSLTPVSKYLSYHFKKASVKTAFDIKDNEGAAIFHYAGHCDLDEKGDGYLIREVPVSSPLAKVQKVYAAENRPRLQPFHHPHGCFKRMQQRILESRKTLAGRRNSCGDRNKREHSISQHQRIFPEAL